MTHAHDERLSAIYAVVGQLHSAQTADLEEAETLRASEQPRKGHERTESWRARHAQAGTRKLAQRGQKQAFPEEIGQV